MTKAQQFLLKLAELKETQPQNAAIIEGIAKGFVAIVEAQRRRNRKKRKPLTESEGFARLDHLRHDSGMSPAEFIESAGKTVLESTAVSDEEKRKMLAKLEAYAKTIQTAPESKLGKVIAESVLEEGIKEKLFGKLKEFGNTAKQAVVGVGTDLKDMAYAAGRDVAHGGYRHTPQAVFKELILPAYQDIISKKVLAMTDPRSGQRVSLIDAELDQQKMSMSGVIGTNLPEHSRCYFWVTPMAVEAKAAGLVKNSAWAASFAYSTDPNGSVLRKVRLTPDGSHINIELKLQSIYRTIRSNTPAGGNEL